MLLTLWRDVFIWTAATHRQVRGKLDLPSYIAKEWTTTEYLGLARIYPATVFIQLLWYSGTYRLIVLKNAVLRSPKRRLQRPQFDELLRKHFDH